MFVTIWISLPQNSLGPEKPVIGYATAWRWTSLKIGFEILLNSWRNIELKKEEPTLKLPVKTKSESLSRIWDTEWICSENKSKSTHRLLKLSRNQEEDSERKEWSLLHSPASYKTFTHTSKRGVEVWKKWGLRNGKAPSTPMSGSCWPHFHPATIKSWREWFGFTKSNELPLPKFLHSGEKDLGENLVRSVWTLFTFLSLQTLLERVVDYGFHQRFTAMITDQVCPSGNKLTSIIIICLRFIRDTYYPTWEWQGSHKQRWWPSNTPESFKDRKGYSEALEGKSCKEKL